MIKLHFKSNCNFEFFKQSTCNMECVIDPILLTAMILSSYLSFIAGCREMVEQQSNAVCCGIVIHMCINFAYLGHVYS